MRIIGGHDYFDSVLAHGSDPSIVLQRRKFEDAPVLPFAQSRLAPLLRDYFSFLGRNWRHENSLVRRKTEYRFFPHEIWFAGKRYGGVKVETHAASVGFPARAEKTEWYWDLAKFEQFLASIDAKLDSGRGFISDHAITATNLREHFEREPTRAETDWLIENRVSIAVWNGSTSQRYSKHWHQHSGWKIDVDGLGNMGFAKKLDPFAAFQELSMWVGGVLPRPGAPMVEITDERTKVRKHGMDEWSFRTPPGMKR